MQLSQAHHLEQPRGRDTMAQQLLRAAAAFAGMQLLGAVCAAATATAPRAAASIPPAAPVLWFVGEDGANDMLRLAQRMLPSSRVRHGPLDAARRCISPAVTVGLARKGGASLL